MNHIYKHITFGLTQNLNSIHNNKGESYWKLGSIK